jgi:hypothetical protein
MSFMRGGTERRGIKVTRTEALVYDALTETPEWPGIIANRAGLKNMSRSEAGAKYCILLVGKGLAIKHGTRMFPKWSRSPTSQENAA